MALEIIKESHGLLKEEEEEKEEKEEEEELKTFTNQILTNGNLSNKI